MKRKTLTTALLAGLAGTAGIANIADAVNQNPHGLGQVLIYPYYTTRGGVQGVNDYDTIISIVNTTEQAKGVKIRFLEALNSKEVLDFNLYMSAFDVWTASVADNGTGAAVSTTDNSCTVPSVKAFGPVAFRTLLFDEFFLPSDEDRTREGYLEAIEMGVLTGAAAIAATHDAGVPVNCDMLAARWTPPPVGGSGSCAGPLNFAGNIGCWLTGAGGNGPSYEVEPPTGGLFGGAQLVNVFDGQDYGYNAVALGDCSDTEDGFHTSPGNLQPNLGNCRADSWVADYEFSGTTNPTVHFNSWTFGFQAVSSTLMVDTVMNEYATEEELGGGTDWVLTFPTKRLHLDSVVDNPFTDDIEPDVDGDDFCEDYSFFFWDREERFPIPDAGDTGFSPAPTSPDVELPKFCTEVFVLTFNESDVLYSKPASDFDSGDGPRRSANTLAFGDEFDAGWARIDFNSNFTPIPGFSPPDVTLHRMQGSNSGFEGLPMVGFAVRRTTNSSLDIPAKGTVLSNYGALFEHATVQDISFTSFD